MSEDVTERVSREFVELIKKIQIQKIKNNTASLRKRKTFSTRRITLAMTRHPVFNEIVVPDIIKADLE